MCVVKRCRYKCPPFVCILHFGLFVDVEISTHIGMNGNQVRTMKTRENETLPHAIRWRVKVAQVGFINVKRKQEVERSESRVNSDLSWVSLKTQSSSLFSLRSRAIVLRTHTDDVCNVYIQNVISPSQI